MKENYEAQHYTVLDDTCLKTRLKGGMHIQTLTKPGVISKLKNMFGVTKTVQEVKVSITKENFLKKSINAGKRQLHNKMIAPIIIWDFGGHDVFYSTHQTFLTYRAIYMIVLDGSRTIDDPCQHEQFIPGKSGPKTARGIYQKKNILVWLFFKIHPENLISLRPQQITWIDTGRILKIP